MSLFGERYKQVLCAEKLFFSEQYAVCYRHVLLISDFLPNENNLDARTNFFDPPRRRVEKKFVLAPSWESIAVNLFDAMKRVADCRKYESDWRSNELGQVSKNHLVHIKNGGDNSSCGNRFLQSKLIHIIQVNA